MFGYKEMKISVEDILLDIENPRFYFGSSIYNLKYSQEELKDILKAEYEVNKLVESIGKFGGLFPAEKIVCYEEGEKYIVVEGNRRICACKILLANENTCEKLIEKISRVEVIVYKNRSEVIPYLSNRHIEDGIKKWKPIEKDNFYVKLYFEDKKNIEEIKNITQARESEIRKAILQNNFFKTLIECTIKKYGKISTFNIDYLPIIDKILPQLAGNDEEIGLDLKKNDQGIEYIVTDDKKQVYEEILSLIGEAFIKREKNGEPSRVTSPEVKNKNQLKKLIEDNIRISGLKELIEKYKKDSSQENLVIKETILNLKLKRLDKKLDNSEKNKKLEKKDADYLISPKIKFVCSVPYEFIVNKGENLDISTLYKCTDSKGNEVADFEKISCFIDDKKIENKIYSTLNDSNSILRIEFNDPRTGIVINQINVKFIVEKNQINSPNKNISRWDLPIKSGYTLMLSNEVRTLYDELKNMDKLPKKFNYATAACLRTLFELSYNSLSSKCFYKSTSKLNEKLEVIEGQLTKLTITNISKSTEITYSTLNNRISLFNWSKICSILNLVGHTSNAHISDSELDALINDVNYLVVIMNELSK